MGVRSEGGLDVEEGAGAAVLGLPHGAALGAVAVGALGAERAVAAAGLEPEHDLFIQQNFFSNPQQVAWVFDPHTDEEGCFGWIGGSIEKLSDIRVGYSQAVEITDSAHDEDLDDDQALESMVRPLNGEKSSSREPALANWMILAVGCLFALMIGFALGFFFVNWKMASSIDRLHQVEKQIERNEQERKVLEKIALEGIIEQRRARRFY